MPMSTKYYDFFVANSKSLDVFLQGGRRSRKTWSTLEWLNILTKVMAKACHRKMKVIVLCYSFNHQMSTINDFQKCLHANVRGIRKIGVTDGAIWEFVYCDDFSKAIGTECDFLFVNEASDFWKRQEDEDILTAFSVGVRCQKYYNFNPINHSEYLDTRLNEGSGNLLCTTWRDNPYLTDVQRAEFELMRTKALRKNASAFDIRNYKVFYLGEFAQLEGNVFHTIGTCTPSEFREVPAEEYYAIDFGFSTSGDPTVLVGVKIFDDKLYCHQYIYEKGLTSNKELIKKMEACGLNEDTLILGDYGGMGKGRMRDLRLEGWSIVNAIKTGIADGLSQMNTFDAIIITTSSQEALWEFQRYELKQSPNGSDKYIGEDHAIDACRYATVFAKRYQ